MNWFFFLNFAMTVLVTFPFFKLKFTDNESANLIIKLIISFFIICYVTIRGRYSIDMKKGFLNCNSYPFYRKIKITDINKINVSFNAVKISMKNNSQVEVDYFWGIKSGINKKVTAYVEIINEP